MGSVKLVIGCGYLGSRVAERWLAQGHRVLATTRNLRRADELLALGIQPVLCDILDPASLKALPMADSVVYAIGLDRTSGASMHEVYVRGLDNVLGALRRPTRFLYASGTGVYGQSGGEEVTETSITDPRELAGKVVLEAEQLLRRRLPGAVILRLSGLYGPDRLIGSLFLTRGEPAPGPPDHYLNVIHVDDATTALLTAESKAPPGEIYNVSDDQPVPRREFYLLLAQQLRTADPVFKPSGSLVGDRRNRRISNRKMRQELEVPLHYPTYREGLPASVAASSTMKK